jgi:hypothetical protein
MTLQRFQFFATAVQPLQRREDGIRFRPKLAAQCVAQRDEIHVGRDLHPVLPVADALAGHAHGVGQLLLGEPRHRPGVFDLLR